MATLYEGEMASIYEAMYQTFVNYDEEYAFYKNILDRYNCNSVIEIGAGTGNLAYRFSEDNFVYTGIDYSQDMLTIAKNKYPNLHLLHGDMRDFKLKKKANATIITGRTTSYIITNKDFHDALTAISNNLDGKRYLIFDFIDASRYIPFILDNKDIEHKAVVNGKTYSRIGNWYPTELDNFLLKWEADYFVASDNDKKFIQRDSSIVRVFTKEEIELHLKIKGFEIIECIDRKTYAYDTYVVVAKKVV
ncbi:MAG TPA: class I SAM-dependent methyltransferase [Flavobacterium sp.]|nr:class I SAM-dependent methyltransferase [Flavobacterium sp.]